MDLRHVLSFVCLIFLIITPPVSANVYGVTPIQLFLSAKQSIGSVQVTNHSDESGLLQLGIVEWQQIQGKDVYKTSQDILMTPPLFKLPPHKTQVIRFALKHPTFDILQKTYRLHIKDLEQPRKKESGQTLYFLMDISLPLFVQPQHIVEHFTWSAQRLNSQQLKLKLHNDGNITLFVKEWQLLSEQKPEDEGLKKTTFTYVLPRQSHSWLVTLNSQSHYTHIKSNINAQNKKSDIRVL